MKEATLNTYTVPHTSIKCPHCGDSHQMKRAKKNIEEGTDFKFCPHCEKAITLEYRETSGEGLVIAKPFRNR